MNILVGNIRTRFDAGGESELGEHLSSPPVVLGWRAGRRLNQGLP